MATGINLESSSHPETHYVENIDHDEENLRGLGESEQFTLKYPD
jgi:hypothetical protein